MGREKGYLERIAELRVRYRADGDTLLHGDYFPGSWLRTPAAVVIIDPEFCFLGPPEFDLGILRAHLILTKQEDLWPTMIARYTGAADWRLADRFAGVELMRRLNGVEQQPWQEAVTNKRVRLDHSRRLLCG